MPGLLPGRDVPLAKNPSTGTAQQRLFLVLKVVLHAVVVISEVLRFSTKSRCSRCCRHISTPKSGLALKKFINAGAGVVNSDYCGEVGVVLFNHGDQDFEVKMKIEYLSLYWRKSTHRQWRRCKVLTILYVN